MFGIVNRAIVGMALSERTQTIINLATGIFTVIVQFAVGFFLSPFIVKHLGAEANGFSQLANNFVMYASLLTIAFNSMAGRFVSVSYHKGNLEDARKYYSSICLVNLFMVALLLPLAIYVVINLDGLIKIDQADPVDLRYLFSFVFLNFFANLITSLFSIGLFVKNSIFYTNLINAVKILLNATLLLIVFSAFPPHIYFISLIAACLTLVAIPVFSILQKRVIPELGFEKNLFSWSYVKDLFSSGIWNTINQAGHLLNTGLDLLLANLFISPFSMGLLSVSKTVPTALTQIANTINNNFAPSITKQWASSDKMDLLKELRTNMKISCILVSVPIVTFCCFSNEFFSLWQPTLDAKALSVLSILTCLPFIPLAGTHTLYNIFTAANKLKVNSISFIIIGLVNIICVYLYLKGGGKYGIYIIAGISSILSIIRNLAINLPYTARILKWYEFYKDVAIALLCCSINWILYQLVGHVNIEGWIGLIVKVFAVALLACFADALVLLKKGTRKSMVDFVVTRIKSVTAQFK